jgi:hypothetical protein
MMAVVAFEACFEYSDSFSRFARVVAVFTIDCGCCQIDG